MIPFVRWMTYLFIGMIFFVSPQADALPDHSPSQQHLFIFVSFSMPSQSLKRYLADAHPVKGIVVIRGLIHHSFKETVLKITTLLEGKEGGLQIDPTLFKKYGITQVPAVVLGNEEAADVLYGDIPLMDALDAFARQGTVSQVEAAQRLKKFSET